MRVERYHIGLKDVWDGFARASRNGTFLFCRDYMDYHQARFEDHSLLIWSKEGQLLALLPANRKGSRVESHGGLTYGGFVLGNGVGLSEMLSLFEPVLARLRADGITALLYKTMPSIHHQIPTEEDRYALFRAGATLLRREAWAVLSLPAPLPLESRRRRGVAKAHRAGLDIRTCSNWSSYWELLTEVLRNRHQVGPVHSLEEIQRLAQLFPTGIRLVGAFKDEQMLAGTVLFETGRVSHAQYIASSPAGRELGALDLLFSSLLAGGCPGKSFFSFGASTEQGGYHLNDGLMVFKEGFGARTLVHDTYELLV